MKKLLLFDTSIASDNIGDQIIVDYCEQQLLETKCSSMFVYKVPTHIEIGSNTHKLNKKANYSIVCGSNILKTTILINQLWKLTFRNVLHLKGIIPMGVGWHNYNTFNIDPYTKWVYKRIFSKDMLLSVRDKYTEKKLNKIGIKNVVFTSCPTMWRFTPEFCKEIPKDKSDHVLTTLTYYKNDKVNDAKMLDTLIEKYSTVYFFPQQPEDADYIKELGYESRVIVLEPNLFAFDKILSQGNVDFIGTRLHAGIRALNFKRRTIIIGIDNRAIEINKDTNLPVLHRNSIDELAEQIDSSFETSISLPFGNINQWKQQFV